MGEFRKNRLAEEIKKEISDIIRGMKDPGLGLVSITKVDVDKDMSCAKVYVSHFADNSVEENCVQILQKAGGYIRKELSQRLKTRTVPELIFIGDNSIEQGFKISQILADYEKDHQK